MIEAHDLMGVDHVVEDDGVFLVIGQVPSRWQQDGALEAAGPASSATAGSRFPVVGLGW
jgi:hypothetical protein